MRHFVENAPMRYLTITLAACAVVLPAYGHHSDAALEMDRVLTLEGTVTEFSLRNPHAYVVVSVTDENGEQQEWTAQMGSMITLMRRGWARDSLAVGDEVTVALHPARDGRPYGLVTTVEKGGAPIGVDVPIETQRNVAVSQMPRATSVEGRWIVDSESLSDDYPGGLDQLAARDLTLTERGRIAYEAFSQDSEENPELTCVPKPTPSMIVYTDLYPIEITDNGDQTLTIRSQYFDDTRTVYMDGRAHPDPSVRSATGHSVGHYEGDTLVVDTRNFADHRSPYQNGIPSGAQKHVVERYRLIDDGARMEVEFFLEDPEYIVGSMTHRRALLYRPNSDMSPFNCDEEATRRFLPSNLSGN
jgi:hypothetical protein